MARKSKGQSGGTSNQNQRVDWKGFANVPLTEHDKGQIQSGVFGFEDVLEEAAEMLATGHKIGLSFDRDRNTVTASATGVSGDCVNQGYTLTSFAGSIDKALTVLVYKHRVVAKGNWAQFYSQPDRGDFG